MSKTLVIVLRGLVSIALLAYCVSLVDTETIFLALSRAHIGIVCVAFLIVIIETIIGAMRFKILLDPEKTLSFAAHIRQYFWASYFNQMLPSSIGGDALRIYWLGRDRIPIVLAGAFVVLERIIGVVTLIAVAAFAVLFVDLEAHLETLVVLAFVASVTCLVVTLLVVRISPCVVVRGGRWGRLLGPLRGVATRPKRLFAVFCISGVYQLLTVAVSYVVAVALGIPISFATACALVPLVWFATMIPISLGGIGVREYAFITVLAFANISSESALLVSLGTYAVFLAAGVVGGVWFTFGRSARRT